MIILDRLHRGDRPCMVAVTAAQTKDRLVFADDAGADAFIEAHRRADPASSFTKFEVPEITLADFWRACRDSDWHYDASDDSRVWREGGAAASRLAVQATISHAHRRMYIDWRRHHFSGPAYGTDKHPAPHDPSDNTYRGWTISHDPPPIPMRDYDWRATGPNYDASYEGAEDGWVDNGEKVSDATREALIAEIDAWFEEHAPADAMLAERAKGGAE